MTEGEKELRKENKELKIRLAEAENALKAIRKGTDGLAFIPDNTENKEKEEALKESEKRYRELVKYAPTGICEIDFQSQKFVSVNDALALMTGYSREELLTMGPLDILEAESKTIYRSRMKNIHKGEKPTLEVEYKLQRKDGQIKYLLLNTSFKIDEHDNPIGAMVVGQDITERKRAEEALRQSEERLKLAQKASGAGVWDWDIVTNELAWSPEFFELFGLDPATENASFDIWRKVLHPDDLEFAEKNIYDAIQSHTPLANEYRINIPNGETKWIRALGNTTFDKDNHPVRMSGICIDITDQKKAEKALQKSEEMFRLALSNATVTVAIQDKNLVYQWSYNQKTRRPDEIIGKKDADLFEPEDLVWINPLKQEILESGREMDVENWLTSNGRRFYMRFHYEPIRDSSGVISGIGMATIDLTDRKIAEDELKKANEELRREIAEREFAEKALKESEERFEKAFESNPVALSISRLSDGLFANVNESFLRLFGYARNELIGNRSTGTNMYSNPENRQEIVRMLKEKDKFSNYEVVARTKTGEKLITLVSAEKISFGGEDHILFATMDITERKRNEEILRENKEQLAAVFNGVSETLMLLDTDGNILAANKIADKRLNQSSSDIVGKNIFRIIPVEYHKIRRQQIAELIRTKEPLKFLDTFKDFFQEISFYPVFDGKGNVHQFISSALDITERKQAEREIQVHRELLETVVNNTPVGIDVIRGSDLTIRLLNPAYQAIAPGKEMLGKSLDELWPETGQAFSELCRKVLETGESYHAMDEPNMVSRGPDKPPELGYFTWSLFRVKLPEEEGWGIMNTSVETTGRVLAEQAIRESERENAKLAKLLELGSQPFGIGFPDGRMGMANHAFEELTGYTREELLSVSWNNVLTPPEYLKKEEDHLTELIKTGNPVRYEKEYIRKDGSRVPIEMTVNVMTDVRGNPEYFFAFISDITERKKYEQNLHQLIRTLRAMQKSSLLMSQAMDEQKFLQDVCKIIVEDCGHKMVWIGYKQNDRKKSVKPVAYAGFEENYLEKLKITWDDTIRGRGPTGMAIRTGKPSLCRNMQTDPDFKPWRKEAIKRGFSSSIVLPLFNEEEVFGVMNIYSKDPDPFSGEEEQLLSKLANDLAYGIKAIRMNIALHRAKDNLEVKVEERTSLLQKTLTDLEAEKQRFQDVLNMIPAFVALITPDYHVKFSNKIYQESFGKPLDKECYDHLFGRTYVCANCKIKEVLKTRKPCYREWTGPNGRIYHKSNFLFTDIDGTPFILEMGVDITEKKNMEKLMLSKILETEENDRRRFASDLHDDLGPTLSAIKLQMNLLSTEKAHKERTELLNISDELLSETIEKVRTLANNLMPRLIASYGLETAVRSFIDKMEKTCKIKFRFQSNLADYRFEAESELHLYRIITELVNNTIKHSGANEVILELNLSDQTLKIVYSDNGKGYNFQKDLSEATGIGLHNIMNRATLVNGTIDFLKKAGKIVVTINKPLTDKISLKQLPS